MNYSRMLEHLYSLESSKFKLGLENIKSLLKKLGSPEKSLRYIHVAGTNGKGSVCAMLFSVLRQAGYNVGLYTSPHLKKFNERIRYNGIFITDREIVDYYIGMEDKITNQSFFEITTAIAFMYFKDKRPDFVILEVGLGGRLDATNVVMPLISVITNIDYEHTNLLGNTMEKIAHEKAGIIKDNVPVVTGADGAALATIKKIAVKMNAPLIKSKKFNKINFRYLNGAFQQDNANTALAAIGALRKYHKTKINDKEIIEGMENAKWPGRLQFIGKNVLVDCAHNPNGIRALVKEIKLLNPNHNFSSLIIVFGVLKDKNAAEMLNLIFSLKPKLVIFTQPISDRALRLKELLNISKKINKSNIKIYTIKKPADALRFAKKMAKNDLIIVTGSIYLVGELVQADEFKKRHLLL
ncbi:bifunctional folylpolyglutamate synthase/dihydrofolate synthase [Candidatus Woesearchaeota archaeon]|nr:bifunctional folylpolyglutamate synthase/dihydrofolate synthase [Candidatus Woesearchaeota archaeon]